MCYVLRSAYDYWFWVPIVGPHIGALCGALVYMLLIGIHLADDEETHDDELKEIVITGE